MKYTIVFLGVISAIVAAEREEWINFKTHYGKTYHSIQEEKLRYNIFQRNLATIQEHNKKYANGESTFNMAINRFADMTPEEFKSMLGYKQEFSTLNTFTRRNFNNISDEDIPESMDWRTQGAVTDVKDQGNCGSCWTFSVTGAVEGQYYLASGKLLSLSEQELVDCDDTCYGCAGGWLDKALEWIQGHGLELEKDYPYEGINNKCRYVNSSVAVRISGYEAVAQKDENALKKAVAVKGPVSVAINANNALMLYKSGVFDDPQCSPDYLNHGVLAVGYGTTDDGQDYWIVKNSWGLSWGEEGYIRMSRNKNNQCGISDQPVYSLI